VAVKPENLLRHLNDTHPRHPDTPRVREQLKSELGPTVRRKAATPIRIRRWQVALAALVVLGGVGVYYALPYLDSGANEPFPCVVGANYVYHWHTQLAIYSNNIPFTIPADIGISAGCLEPVHTHRTDGTIHIETTVARLYSIGDFFRVWGKSFDSPTPMLVNGTTTTPNANTVLYDGETITLYYASFT
jgi:hypothetical protein